MAGYDSLYFGKVIRDSDLLNKEDTRPYNRVKVLIVGQTSIENERFQQPLGRNNPSTISKQALDIVDKELYAYVMQPVAGTGSGAVYNANKDIISISDTGNITDLNGKPPAETYFGITDGFIGGIGSNSAGVNPNASAYSPDNRSNAYKGMMALPSVGANVVVSFMNGVRGMPVVIGVIPSAADVDSIHGMGLGSEIYPSYPFAYSNLSEPNETVEGGAAGEAAAASDDVTASAASPGASTEPAADDDYSDIPADLRKSIDTFLKYDRPDLAAEAANDYRARESSKASSRAEVLALIREEKGDAAAERAKRSYEEFDREYGRK